MPLFSRHHEETLSELDEQLERIEVTDKIRSKQADIAEKDAVIAQLKKQYGPSWAKRLGVSKLTDIASLRSFLRGAKKGMEQAASVKGTPLNPSNFKGITRA
jgi:hypothetical protein